MPTPSATDLITYETLQAVANNVARIAETNNFTAYQTISSGGNVDNSTSITANTVPGGGALRVVGGIAATNGIKGSQVYNAVWNDLTDRIPVDEECELEYGKCYCFDGNHYYQSNEYCPAGIIGIHSDTGGFEMGHKEGVKELQCSVAGFVLAYVDREYPVGTALTPTCCGYLTEISKKDKMEYPERIVATFWKPESLEEWGSDTKKVKVNGRMWVKVK